MCLPHSCAATILARTHIERIYCCVTSQHKLCAPLLRMYGPLPRNGCFSASIIVAFNKYATIFYIRLLKQTWNLLKNTQSLLLYSDFDLYTLCEKGKSSYLEGSTETQFFSWQLIWKSLRNRTKSLVIFYININRNSFSCFSHFHFHSYVLSNDTSRPNFNVILHV
jgi:hypothetical protein